MRLRDLTPGQAGRLSILLDEALALPEAQRASWLARLEVREPDLHGAVAGVLAATRTAADPRLEVDALVARRFLAAEVPEPALAGRLIGPWRVLRLLGQGGMGSVWLAERADGLFERQIALKLVHPGLVGPAVAERFARERRILAALDHPAIARLLDAGVSAEGQPYLAIELVDGTPIDAWCDARRAPLRERVALVAQVLQAVQHAHQALVVHRDLKPSNILVDDGGRVRLLDFGIAKLLRDGAAAETELTQAGGRPLTPSHASPEQLRGAPVSTASDVYAMGVVLYQLLCGQSPYRPRRPTRASLEEAILGDDVARPSQQPDDAAAARARATTPRRLRQALAGDLDSIALKALRKRPEDRYPTAAAMRADLVAHLDGDVVRARPDSVLYRGVRWIARHRAAVAAITGVGLALGAGLVATAWEARRATEQAARAQAVQAFVTGLFDQADPSLANGHPVTARDLLDRGQRDVATRLASQPALQAELDGTLASLYRKLGDEERALPLAQARSELVRRQSGADSIAYADALAAQGDVVLALDRHAEALKLLEAAGAIFARHPRERGPALLRLELRRLTALSEMGRIREAEAGFEALVPRLQAAFGRDAWEVVEAKAGVEIAANQLRDDARIDAVGRDVEAMLAHVDDAHRLRAALLRSDLGYAQMEAVRSSDAVRSYRGAIAEFDRLVGPDNSRSITAGRELSGALMDTGRYDLAAQAHADTVARALRLFGEGHPQTRLTESFDVLPLVFTGHAHEAVDMAQRALREPGADAEMSAGGSGMRRRLAIALVADGRAAEALPLIQSLAAKETAAGRTATAAHARTMLDLAGALSGTGRLREALQAARDSEAAVRAAPQMAWGDIALAHALLTQALLRARLHDTDGARAAIADAQAHFARRMAPGHPAFDWVDLVRAEVLKADGQAAAGEALDRATRAHFRATGGVVLPQPLVFVF